MKRLVYSPKVYAYVRDPNGNVRDISPYIVSGNVTRKINQVSSAELVLRNPNKIFTQPGDGIAFRPQDPITIFLQRLHNHPVQVFTGYLDKTPYYQMYPGNVKLRASCTLKKLMYTFFDPALPYTLQFMNQYGWQSDAQGTLYNQAARNIAADPGSPNPQLNDGSIGKLLHATLVHIAEWPNDQIAIEALPPDLITRMTQLYSNIAADNVIVAKELEHFFGQIIGQVSYGGSGNSDNSAGASGSSPAGPGGWIRCGATIDTAGGYGYSEATFQSKQSYPSSYHGGMSFAELLLDAPESANRAFHSANLAHVLGYPGGGDFQGLPGGTVLDVRMPGGATMFQMAKSDNGSGHPTDQAHFKVDLHETIAKKLGWTPNQDIEVRLHGRGDQNATGTTTSGGAAAQSNTQQIASGSADVLQLAGIHPGSAAGGGSTHYDAIVAAAQHINDQHLPYVYGGGHGRSGVPTNGGYDCSGAVSAVLAAAGYTLPNALDSTGFMSWGDPGPGQVTIFASPSHVFMRIGNRYWGTSDGHNGGGGGGAWLSDAAGGGYLSGFTQRHPPDLSGNANVVLPGGGGSPGITLKAGQIVHPIPKGLQADFGQIDQGVDITTDPAGHTPLLAIGDGTIVGHGNNQGQDGGFGPDMPILKLDTGEFVYYGHAGPGKKVQNGTKVKAGQVIGEVGAGIVGTSGGPHLEIGYCSDANGVPVGPPGNASAQKMAGLIRGALRVAAGEAIGAGGGAGSTSPGGTGNPLSLDDVMSAAKAAAFAATINFPSALAMNEAVSLHGDRSLMNDKPILPFLQQLTQASMRSFMSMPNGHFFAFYPDYFGEVKHEGPYWLIDDIEVLEGGIDLTDENLVTHMYVIGDTTPAGGGGGTSSQLINELSTAGVITIFNAFGAGIVETDAQKALGQKTSNPSSWQGLDHVMSKDQAIKFLQRYGARPANEPMPMVRSPWYEMFLAYQMFMQAWARQFSTPFTMTFMPELFPGGIVGFKDHGLQMYIEEVVHAFDYETGFTTVAQLSAPSIMAGVDSTITDKLPPNMVRALADPVQQTSTPVSDEKGHRTKPVKGKSKHTGKAAK